MESWEAAERVFRRPESAKAGAAGMMVLGVLALVGAAVGFMVALVGRVGSLALQAMTTLPILVGLGAISSARSMARAPEEVGVSEAGVRVSGRGGTTRYGWGELGWASVQAAPLGSRKQLLLFDPQGKVLTKVDEAIEEFDALADLVTARIAARPDPTAGRVQLGQARRNAAFMAFGGVMALALAAANVMIARNEARAAHLMKTAAVPGQARVVRRFTAPNGVTRRLEYEIRTSDGRSGKRNGEVQPAYWESLEGAQAVPVVYVPSEPSVSRLAHGEVEERDAARQPAALFGLSAVVALMGLFFLGASALAWRGWDIDMDSKTGKISLKRFGTGR